MAKRHYAEFEDQLDGGGVGPVVGKKAKMADAMEYLTDRADDLIECLQALKSQGKTPDAALIMRLSSLSRELLPSFKSIANPADDTAEETIAPQTPVLPVLTQWSPSEVAETLPPLPPILDPAMELAAFTHAGACKEPGDRSYDKLEWLGDAYLYLMATSFIYLTFPHIKHGDMCHIREVLVRNSTLGGYSVDYGFDTRIIYPAEYHFDGRQGSARVSAKERDKVLGDVFEAHVAAIILSDPIGGVAKTASWIKSLWSTTISEQIKSGTWRGWKAAPSLLAPTMSLTPSHQVQVPGGSQVCDARQTLNAELALANPRVLIEYRSLEADWKRNQKRDPLTNHRLFTVGAYLVGYGETVLLGSGTDKKKKDANLKAAQKALDNKKLMNVYRVKKQAILDKIRAAQQVATKGLDF